VWYTRMNGGDVDGICLVKCIRSHHSGGAIKTGPHALLHLHSGYGLQSRGCSGRSPRETSRGEASHVQRFKLVDVDERSSQSNDQFVINITNRALDDIVPTGVSIERRDARYTGIHRTRRLF